MTQGWTVPNQGERSVRDREHSLVGQNIWLQLVRLGFVQDNQKWNGGKPFKQPKREECLKNWLIWGYWEKNK